MTSAPLGTVNLQPRQPQPVGVQPGQIPIQLQQATVAAQQQGQQQVVGQVVPPSQVPQEPPKDSLLKARTSVPALKDALIRAVKIASQNIYQNGSIDASTSSTFNDKESGNPARFEKCLEEFFGICDQIELNLRSAHECGSQANSSNRYTPYQVNVNRLADGIVPANSDAISYNAYLQTVKTQARHARDLQQGIQEAISPSGPPSGQGEI